MVKFDDSDFDYSFVVKPIEGRPHHYIKLNGFTMKGMKTLKKNNWLLVIPDEIEGLPVRFIGNSAFENCMIEKLTLGKNIISIGEDAFRINSIHKVEIPESVESIEIGAFADNNIEEVISPNDEFHIGDPGFTPLEKGAYKLKEEDIEYEVISTLISDLVIIKGITNEAKKQVITRKAIFIPDKINGIPVKTISYNTFENLGLKYVRLPIYLEDIYPEAFKGNNLNEISIPNTIKHIDITAFLDNGEDNVSLTFYDSSTREDEVTDATDKKSTTLIW